jgi:hypothetical protein
MPTFLEKLWVVIEFANSLCIILEGNLTITLGPTRKSAEINPLIAPGVPHLQPSLRAILTVLLNNSATQD